MSLEVKVHHGVHVKCIVIAPMAVSYRHETKQRGKIVSTVLGGSGGNLR